MICRIEILKNKTALIAIMDMVERKRQELVRLQHNYDLAKRLQENAQNLEKLSDEDVRLNNLQEITKEDPVYEKLGRALAYLNRVGCVYDLRARVSEAHSQVANRWMEEAQYSHLLHTDWKEVLSEFEKEVSQESNKRYHKEHSTLRQPI